MTFVDCTIYALLWLTFGVTHSLLASERIKSHLQPLFGRTYRLSYNVFSALHFGLILVGGRFLLGVNSESFDWGHELRNAGMIGQWAGVAIVVVALTQYDLGRFTGISQLRCGETATLVDDPLHVEGLHRYIRHPLYLGGYLYLWAGASDEFGFQTALWGSVYLAIGTWFEERRLVAQYGQAYEDYRARVPSLLPIKGRAL